MDERKEAVIETYALHLFNGWKGLLNYTIAQTISRDAFEFFVEGKEVLGGEQLTEGQSA